VDVNDCMFRPGQVWNDADGRPIQAHGGGGLFADGTYYWYGENKGGPTLPDPLVGFRVDVIGVSCYSSRDLIHWNNEGVVLPACHDDPGHDLHPSKVVEKPKVIYNETTGKYVMWMHIDHADYAYARTGVAVSDLPAGPFTYLGSFRPCESDSRDMTVFKDAEGKAYLVFSSEWNSVTKVVALTDDYLAPRGECVRVFDAKERHRGREAPAVFKHNGVYYMVSSGCSGWDHNEAQYATADSMFGPWTVHGNPCAGPGAEITFHAQSTFVLPVASKPNAFIFMADRWTKEDLGDSRYVWLPIHIRNTRIEIEWRDAWSLESFD